MAAIATAPSARTLLQRRMADVADGLRARGAHAARCVVLVPYAQLMHEAQAAWAAVVPSGFAPRFETTMNWSRRLGGFVPAPHDLAHDPARDLLVANALLDAAGLGARRAVLAPRLVESALQLAPLAAAVPEAMRPAWAARAQAVAGTGLDAPVLALEAQLARIAVEWAARSASATDVLLRDEVLDALDCLVVLEGFRTDPLTESLKARVGARALVLRLADDPASAGTAAGAAVALHEADSPEDEAERAAACVLRHLSQGRVPVALAATDRALTRRIRAMLGARGVALRDETGWKLSTTRAAAHLVAALRACAWQAGADAVLDWLKNSPAMPAADAAALEKTLRAFGIGTWRQAVTRLASVPACAAAVAQAEAWRAGMQQARPLAAWTQALRELLQAGGQWALLEGDAAGDAVIATLRLAEGAQAEWAQLLQAERRMGAAEFSAWVADALEGASFKPVHPRDEDVVILPFPQMLGLSFAAAVLPGCDELSLPAAPELRGPWTTAQRAGLGLPTREAEQAAQAAAWAVALAVPHCDVLWRRADGAGETLLPSPLVQQLVLAGAGVQGIDAREPRGIAARPVPRPQPRGQQLPVPVLSASAYADLRQCPYRFFALRQLGLKEPEELDTEIGKRDFGTWLHAVLKDFHEALAENPVAPGPARAELMDALAAAQTRHLSLDDGGFLPFTAAWPGVRDGYLAWLAGHEGEGMRFAEAESEQRMPLGTLALMGRIDRVDHAGGAPYVIDYKTESLQATRERVKAPTEDTQLAFYAALLPDDTLRAAYVNVGERETRTVEHPDVTATRDALVDGIRADMDAIGAGAALPALGEGRACDYCAARGLCRKDHWT